MKFLIFLFYFFFALVLSAQLDPSKEWFTMEDFFVQETIQNKAIKSITIYKSDKRDDEIFSTERKVAEYFFSTEGELHESRKFVPLSRRIDTSVFEYKYDGAKLISRIENQGPFSFKYAYVWLNDSTFQEIKIDKNTSDTNYIHRVEIQNEEESKRRYTYYNSVGRPMKSEWITTNIMDKVISKKESYSRSLSFVVDSFNYKATQLIHRLKWNTIGVHKKRFWEFTYERGFLDLIKEMEEGKVVAKLAMLYNDFQLIKSIVKRDVKEKSISIYKVEYDYYFNENSR